MDENVYQKFSPLSSPLSIPLTITESQEEVVPPLMLSPLNSPDIDVDVEYTCFSCLSKTIQSNQEVLDLSFKVTELREKLAIAKLKLEQLKRIIHDKNEELLSYNKKRKIDRNVIWLEEKYLWYCIFFCLCKYMLN